MGRLLAAAMVLSLISSWARADDGLVGAAPVSWTGVYVGGGIGGKSADSEWTTTCLGAACAAGGFNPFTVDDSSPRTFSGSKLRSSVYAGFNLQVDNWLVGVEADAGFGNTFRLIPGIPGCTIFCGSLTPTEDDIDSASIKTLRDGSIRGRAGLLLSPSVLAYATAGVAFQQVQANLVCSFAGPWCFPPTATDVRDETFEETLRGWTAGGGVEWLVHGHWLIRGEYRYADLGSFSPTFFEGTGDDVLTDIRVATQTVTLGLGFKF
jgi:outer membrane immunogenic protein